MASRQVDIVRIEDDDFRLAFAAPGSGLGGADLAPTVDQVGLAFSAFALADGDRRLVVDPWLANDFPVGGHARLPAERRPPHAVASPRDRAGVEHAAVGVADRQLPARPLPLSRPPSPTGRFGPLERQGLLDAVDPPQSLTPNVGLVDAPGHADGHLAVRIESGGELAVIPGHLFLNPFQVADPSEAADVDPTTATMTRRRLLDDLADHDGLLLTNLLGGPGGGVVRRDGSSFALRT